MAIKIQTKQSYIPIELGDVELRFSVTDESLLNLQKGAEKVQKELLKASQSKDDETAIEQTKDVLRRGYDFLFGEGAFEKVYALSESVFITTEYFEQITAAVFEELKKRGFSPDAKQKAEKYIQKKKK